MSRPARARRKRPDFGARESGRRSPTPYEPQVRLLMSTRRPAPPGPDVHGEERERAVCASKQPYLSEALARNAATLMELAGGDRRWAYDCPWCPDWHLTSRPPP